MNRKFILISGKAESGKDTMAYNMSSYLDIIGKTNKIVKCGDFVKSIARDFLNWDGEKDTKGRQLLQDTATCYRQNVNTTYFPEMLSALVKALFPDIEYILVPDTRYEQEIETIMSQFPNDDVFCLRVNRPNHENKLTESQRTHDSETSLDEYNYFDYILDCYRLEDNAVGSIKILEEIVNG